MKANNFMYILLLYCVPTANEQWLNYFIHRIKLSQKRTASNEVKSYTYNNLSKSSLSLS